MGAFICKQPNGLYCRFSTVVDCPTHYNMTKEEYLQYRIDRLKEEVDTLFDEAENGRFPSFDAMLEMFSPMEMSQERFDGIVEEMKRPVEEINQGSMKGENACKETSTK